MNEYNEDNDPDIIDYQSLASAESPQSQEYEERVLAALRSQGLVGNTQQGSVSHGRWKLLAAVAACLILFLSGIFFEKYRSGADPNLVSMTEKTFLLLLMEDQRYQRAKTDREQQERIDLYRNWAITLRQKGVVLNGTKLQPQTYFLPRNVEKAPPSEVAGYFLIDAGDLNQAMEIARTCPHLQFGGQIEVRQIDPV